MLYIQKSVSENAGNCSHRGRKIQKFSGGEYPQTPPYIKCDTTPTFCYQQTIYHLSTLGIVWSLFVDGPPTDEFLKNALAPYDTVQRYTRLYSDIYKAIRNCTTLYNVIQDYTTLYNTIRHFDVFLRR